MRDIVFCCGGSAVVGRTHVRIDWGGGRAGRYGEGKSASAELRGAQFSSLSVSELHDQRRPPNKSSSGDKNPQTGPANWSVCRKLAVTRQYVSRRAWFTRPLYKEANGLSMVLRAVC
jgi:hypothetical protein